MKKRDFLPMPNVVPVPGEEDVRKSPVRYAPLTSMIVTGYSIQNPSGG